LFLHNKFKIKPKLIFFQNGRTVGTLYLNSEENHVDINGCPIDSFSISGFTGAFARVVDSVPGKEVTLFVYADAGSDFFSLKISAVLCSEKKIWSESFKSPKWKLELLHPRSHDTKSPDLPIALHVCPRLFKSFALGAFS
jgi:hypothetical protein